ncbi:MULTISPECIES: hypothetical protein [unclassified Janthinobacterium]|uniref:hypothetical protein n=1 Tax=unclassified Janthinobacterium TaxID=2610881 RepID=UPI001620E970|nr:MULTISPECIES: hypothetical protein [unclassified Janthinobacterium]MBB5610417.1 hypothetical protein [Janthinobacterium sp. S3T4]MBB5615746.1 hypothetical protein [Janthinobacterium sp. S3M3]
MSANKKPRKRYSPKPAVLPPGMRRAIAFEMPGFQASEAMGKGHFQEQHVYDLLSNADMARRIAPDGHAILPVAQVMVEAIAEIQARAQRTGTFGVNGDEMRVLSEGIGKTMVFLRGVSNADIARASMAAISEFNRTGVLRV